MAGGSALAILRKCFIIDILGAKSVAIVHALWVGFLEAKFFVITKSLLALSLVADATQESLVDSRAILVVFADLKMK